MQTQTTVEENAGQSPSIDDLTEEEQNRVVLMNQELCEKVGPDMAHLLGVKQAMDVVPPGEERFLLDTVIMDHLSWCAQKCGFTQEQVQDGFNVLNVLTTKYFDQDGKEQKTS